MLPLENVAAFVVAAVVLIVIPGPSVLFVIGRALSLGRAGALLSVVGNAIGLLVQVVAVALGIGALIEQSDLALEVVRIAGAVFLVYLGSQAIRNRHREATIDLDAPRAPIRRVLGESIVVGVTNPKSIVFFIAVLPQFVAPDTGAVPLQLLELGLIFLVLALAFDSCWALAAGAARDWFARSPRRIAALSSIGGVAMIVLAVILVLAGRSH